MPAKVILEIVAGPMQGRVFEFDRHDTFLLGRKKECHVPVGNDGLASRHHFLMEVNPPEARLRDLGSRNGTYVNGVKHGGRAAEEVAPEQAARRSYPEVDLKHGDQIVVGGTTIRVRIEVPQRCASCQAEIVGADPHGTLPTGEEALCEACRLLPPKLPTAVVQPLTCAFPESGATLQDYQLGEKLGQGGMGAVYRAVRKSDGRVVAIKVMLRRGIVDPLSRDRFLREIAVTGQLVHHRIVQLLANGCDEGAFFFVMEHCSGGSLDALMNQHGGRLPLPLAAPILRQCVEGLEHAHQRKFIHRDLKPQNILLVRRGNGWDAKIADFGLAKNLEQAGLSGMTATGGFGGTRPFMPREQITQFKYCLPVSDVWSMAATFYNVLTGQFPLDFPPHRDPLEVLLGDDPVPIGRRLPDIPPPLAAVLDRALATNPLARYQHGGELRLALDQALTPLLL